MLHLDDIAGSLSLVIGHLQRINDIASYLGKFNRFSVKSRICGAFLLKIISVRRTSS